MGAFAFQSLLCTRIDPLPPFSAALPPVVQAHLLSAPWAVLQYVVVLGHIGSLLTQVLAVQIVRWVSMALDHKHHAPPVQLGNSLV